MEIDMNALDWIRSKAVVKSTEVLEMEDGSAYSVVFSAFNGRLPNRMVYQVLDQMDELVNIPDEVVETIRVGGQYRSDFGKCEFLRTDYIKIK